MFRRAENTDQQEALLRVLCGYSPALVVYVGSPLSTRRLRARVCACARAGHTQILTQHNTRLGAGARRINKTHKRARTITTQTARRWKRDAVCALTHGVRARQWLVLISREVEHNAHASSQRVNRDARTHRARTKQARPAATTPCLQSTQGLGK